MKKTIALVLAAAMIMLCSCTDNSAHTQPDGITAETVAATKEIVTEWNTTVLPEKFPSPPKGTHDLSIVKGDAADGEYAYTTDFYRITFICPETEFYSFTNELLSLGYIGGSKKITDGEYYSDGFKGYWQNGETYIRISNSSNTDNGEIIISLDIAECVDNFPKALEEYFLKFNGFCQSDGFLCGHDANKIEVNANSVNPAEITTPYWHWDFRFSNGFVGVEQKDFEKYFHDIEATGYEGTITSLTVDGMSVFSGDLIKKTGVTDFGVFMLYNTVLKTLDISYTNNTELIIFTEE